MKRDQVKIRSEKVAALQKEKQSTERLNILSTLVHIVTPPCLVKKLLLCIVSLSDLDRGLFGMFALE